MLDVSTLVFVHAHPDDEATQTSGTMARAVAEGHRVVLVLCTDGSQGEVPDDLAEGEDVVARRRAESAESARVLGTHRVAWLGYRDSGMTGWDANEHNDSFHLADLEEAARRLADILDEEDADVVSGYDWHGNYGHPDHVKVHPVTWRAAALAKRRPRVLESTMNRDLMRRVYEQAKAAGSDLHFDPDALGDDGNPIGTPEAELHWRVDISGYLEQKRQALLSHASQATDIGGLTGMPEDAFATAMGLEHFREHGRPNGMVLGWPFGDSA